MNCFLIFDITIKLKNQCVKNTGFLAFLLGVNE